jgi:hypothetical protein
MDPVVETLFHTLIDRVLTLSLADESPLHLIAGDRADLITVPSAVPVTSLAVHLDTSVRLFGFRRRCVACEACPAVLVVSSFADSGDVEARVRRAVRVRASMS